jgi:hypothetical protein
LRRVACLEPVITPGFATAFHSSKQPPSLEARGKSNWCVRQRPGNSAKAHSQQPEPKPEAQISPGRPSWLPDRLTETCFWRPPNNLPLLPRGAPEPAGCIKAQAFKARPPSSNHPTPSIPCSSVPLRLINPPARIVSPLPAKTNLHPDPPQLKPAPLHPRRVAFPLRSKHLHTLTLYFTCILHHYPQLTLLPHLIHNATMPSVVYPYTVTNSYKGYVVPNIL